MKTLKVGDQPVAATIDAARYWNRTGIFLEADATYSLEVQGEQFWFDFWIRTEADGYTKSWLRWAERFRRNPDRQWFALMGSIGQTTIHTFLIGKKSDRYRATASGELLCYANDVPLMYFNNHGSLTLTVARIT